VLDPSDSGGSGRGAQMAWEDPGNNRDPWGGRRSDGPPDLDEVVRKMQERLGGLFGGGGGSRRSRGGRDFGALPLPMVMLLVAALLLWEMAYVVQAGERGVVLRFGSYITTLEPGLSFRLPRPFERVEKVNADLVKSTSHTALMLTRDENIVDVDLEVQYRIKDVKDYLFSTRSPDDTIRQATEAAVREIIGASPMDFVLTEGRSQIGLTTRDTLQAILDQYGTGLLVNVVNIKSAKPPDDVKAAFDDAIKAREDEQRLINEAEAYKNEIIPKARGAAARIRADADAYKSRVTAQAEGDTSRFTQLLEQYRNAPEVTRERLYLETMEGVLGSTAKVLIDGDAGQNLMYLPLDRLLQRRDEGVQPPAAADITEIPVESQGATDAGVRDDGRDRGRR
jgi:membrane protease subunit HflK